MANVVIYPKGKSLSGELPRKRKVVNQKGKTEADIQKDIKAGIYDQFIANHIANDPTVITKNKKATEAIVTKTDIQKAQVAIAGLLYDFRNPEQVEKDLSRLQKEKANVTKKDLEAIFGVEVEDDFTSVYKEKALYKYHDAIRVDGSYSNAVERTNDFVTGIAYTHIVLDVNTSFPSKDAESKELVKLNNNYVLFSIKNELEEIDKTIKLRRVILSTMINMRTYGRMCHLTYTDEVTKLPVAINPLNPIGLGKVYYKKGSWEILGVECEHLEQRLQPSSKLIYAVNRDYGQSPGSLNYGYSDVEFFTHLIETNFVLNAFDLKELNRNNYMPKKIVRVMSQDNNDITEVRKAIETSNQVVTKHECSVVDLSTAGSAKELVEQRSENDDKITQETGMPNILVGKRTSDTFSVATQVMQMFNQTTAKKWRTVIREIFEPQYYNRNMKQIIKNRLDFLNKIKFKYNDGTRDSAAILKDMLPLATADQLTDGEVEELKNLKYEYLLQKDREKWETHREGFFSERFDKFEQSIMDNVSIPFEEGQKVFDTIKSKVTKKGTFKGIENEDDTEEQTNTSEQKVNARADTADNTDTESKWTDYTVPSPSTIEFEIAELEKLIVLEPNEYDFKVKMVFDNVSLMTDLEKATMVTGLVRAGIIPEEKAHQILEFEDLVESKKLEDQLNKTVNKFGKKLGVQTPPEQQLDYNNKMVDIDGENATMMQDGKMKDMSGALGRNFNRQAKQGKKTTVRTDQTSTP